MLVFPPGVLVIVHVPVAGNPPKITLPVDIEHVGWVIVPTVGAEGETGGVLITTDPLAPDVHKEASVTVKVYVPGGISVTVVLVPVPVVVVPPGVLVRVHVPVAGNPLNITLPVGTAQVGWVIVPTIGAVGAGGCGFMTTFPDGNEIQPDAFVTLKVYVPSGIPEIVVLVPVPVVVVPPGVLVRVHVPVAGNPLKITLPVATVQVGCVIVPTIGVEGVNGLAVITTLPDAVEMQPDASVTVKVNVPAGIPVTVVLVPVPIVVIPPGVCVMVHIPVAGKPLNITLPVGTEQVGCVIVPTIGGVIVQACGITLIV